MPSPSRLLFLPGASGDTAFWQPLAQRLQHGAEREIVAYPGLGAEPPDPSIRSLDELLDRVLARLDRPSALIAQSMGGVLARPELVTHLVLCVTSGGIDVEALGAADWRAAFRAGHASLPEWFPAYRGDLTGQLPGVMQPTLLIWGDHDPFSPPAIGERLLGLLPDARLHVVRGGRHDLASVHAAALAPLVEAHLRH